MRKFITLIITCSCLIVFSAATTIAEEFHPWTSLAVSDNTTHNISFGGKYHFDYAWFDEIPIEEGDYSYQLFYEMHNNFAYWQIGGSYTPGPDDDRFDDIITPQINLIAKDRFYRIGMGALMSNVKIDGDSDWTRVYWQVIFGVGIPLGDSLSIDLYGHYLFKHWKAIWDPIAEAPEVSLTISFTF